MRNFIHLRRLQVNLCGALLLLLANWVVVCWYHITTSTTHGDAGDPLTAGDRSSALRSRRQIRTKFLIGSFGNSPSSQSRRLEAATTLGEEQIQSHRTLLGNDAEQNEEERGTQNEEERDTHFSVDPIANDDDDNYDDNEDLEQYLEDLGLSDYNASSVLSRAWVPQQVRTGAYTTLRWSAETLQAFESFLSLTPAHGGCGGAVECRNVTCPISLEPRELISLSEPNTTAPSLNCKTLWVTGWLLKESCDQALLDYSVALATARYFAQEAIQPVVLLAVAKPGLPMGRVVRHLQSQGVIVIQVGKLSFHDFVSDWHARGNLSMEAEDLVLPYWALDVPRILATNGVLNVNKLCPRHVLVTDPDVMFINTVTTTDMYSLQSQLGPDEDAFLAYGTNLALRGASYPSVYFMDVMRFDEHWPEMLEFRQGLPAKSSVHEWLSAYFGQDDKHASYCETLPATWNWSPLQNSALMKKYIKLTKYDSEISNQVAQCNLTDNELTVKRTLCCDEIRNGIFGMHILATHLAPDIQTICPDESISAQDDLIDDDDSDADG